MNDAFRRFLNLPDRDRADVFEETSRRLDTPPAYVEKDFWVCLTLDLLYNGLPDGHPRLLFKGGTSLSKAFQLVPRFSEDIDIVVDRRDLGFSGGSDPTAIGLSPKARERAFARLRSQDSRMMLAVATSSTASKPNSQHSLTASAADASFGTTSIPTQPC